MRNLIINDRGKCVGCNRCIRVCPIPEANVGRMEDGDTKVYIDDKKCIACGACLHACHHGARDFVDDTERFFADLGKGEPISLFFAPASRSNLENWGRILTLLRNMGVRKIYDVSLGADICVWAYIRYIQQKKPVSVITQPCPAVVNYILKHNLKLLPYLAPVQSPMLCTAIYMRKYKGISDKIAALSPCVAKSGEFEDTDSHVSYNITFIKLEEYIRDNNLVLPEKESGWDHVDPALGSIFPMPGGLKENVEFILGQGLRIDRSEGQGVVYHALDVFAKEKKENLPALFDVLNCPEGCNLGTGCRQDKSTFEVNSAMSKAKYTALKGRERKYFDELYRTYDKTLRLEDFMRRYSPRPVITIPFSSDDIEEAFQSLGKKDEISRSFDCGACGSDTCLDMAVKIAKRINSSENCIQKAHTEMQEEHSLVMNWQTQNSGAIQTIQKDITGIKNFADKIVNELAQVQKMMGIYETMAKDISKIALNIHMISLNASIEAARAGESGKSFSVVAKAIRDLAGETQHSTQQISSASTEAKSAMEQIADMVITIGQDITESHNNITQIADSTQKIVSHGDIGRRII
ncbi:MAG: methyl-accepting chemotaxis protein [Desulfarculales bacterium]|jgi:iron only hydrogenase large subunit-like protein|nr:methyl-accepting chemotaxis protein [Desulfarculales bacterium]